MVFAAGNLMGYTLIMESDSKEPNKTLPTAEQAEQTAHQIVLYVSSFIDRYVLEWAHSVGTLRDPRLAQPEISVQIERAKGTAESVMDYVSLMIHKYLAEKSVKGVHAWIEEGFHLELPSETLPDREQIKMALLASAEASINSDGNIIVQDAVQNAREAVWKLYCDVLLREASCETLDADEDIVVVAA